MPQFSQFSNILPFYHNVHVVSEHNENLLEDFHQPVPTWAFFPEGHVEDVVFWKKNKKFTYVTQDYISIYKAYIKE